MKKYLLVTLAAAAAFVITGVLVYQAKRISQMEYAMEELYRSALHQTTEEMNDLSLDMEKTLLSTDPAQSAALLSEISRAAGDVQQCLAFLPLNHQAMLPTLRFANQLSAYAAELLPQVVSEGSLPAESIARLNQQLTLCSQLCGQLALVEETADLEAITLDASYLVESPAAVQARGLPQGEITQEEAIDIARSFVGDDRVVSIQAAPGTSGSLAAYGVTVQTQDVQLNLEVTRQGGKVLWMMPETASFPVTQSIQACREAAQVFLELHGFGSMQAAHHQVYDGLCVISFAPLQGDVLLYPDLVKVQVRMDSAQIVGLEAHSYWINHVQRDLPQAQLTLEEAQAHLTDHVQVESSRLCVIPDGESEKLCYEFSVSYNGEAYLIYIDAQNGHEVQLLKTIPVENGAVTA